MILNGSEIKSFWKSGAVQIDPYEEGNVGPNSYDVRLGYSIVEVQKNSSIPNGKFCTPIFCPYSKESNTVELNLYEDEKGFYTILYPGKLYLGHTVEKIGSDHFVPMLEGKSSIGRMGLSIHVTAGVGDIGFKSKWTLEMTTVMAIKVYPGMKIGQVIFYECSSREMLYEGKYVKQEGPVASKYWEKE